MVDSNDPADNMSNDNVDNIHLSPDEALALGMRALQHIGYTAIESRFIAAHLVDSALCGYPALGLSRILTIAEHPRHKQPRRAIKIVHETPCSALIDGGNYVGFYACQHAAEVA